MLSLRKSLRSRAASFYHSYIHDSPLLNPHQIDYTRDLHRNLFTTMVSAIPAQLQMVSPQLIAGAIMEYWRKGPAQPSWSLQVHVTVHILRDMLTAFNDVYTDEEMAALRNYLTSFSTPPLPWRAKVRDDYVAQVFRARAIEILASLNVDVSALRTPEKEPAQLHGEWFTWQDDETDGGAHGPTTARNGVILHLHGGAYVICSSKSHRPLAWRLARDTGLEVFLPNYRLAPEDPFPAGLADCVASYLWLTDRTGLGAGYLPSQVVIGGDSAGGGLTGALLQIIRDAKLDCPAGAYLWSPWTDMTNSSKSFEANGATDYLPGSDISHLWMDRPACRGEHFYVRRNDMLRSPYVSPLFGDLSNFPPILVQTGKVERLYDESVQFAEKVNANNDPECVPVRLEMFEEMPHVWQMLLYLPSAKEAMRRTALFVQNALRHASEDGTHIKMRGWRATVSVDGEATLQSW
ncbi:Alpha/Beta hydrolase protein [Thamnocephalis sphaerospora]|uniref:Alpha/Beta hydrolase protein n=1 Tax=Thamnocephalis sphaerospora TaxID=78915 RepID=A0A4P9XUR3_9FUNG|nr:Alpha/Beta hydrolase protein [Thamnocephalis sphaerospora]|eukprot:RKP09975.1 Alpha/Beta hydrolase protein [Thamnocephalis sphaerospora]